MRYYLLLFAFLIFSCNTGNNQEINSDWLIPVEEVFDGGPGKDGIPSIDNPDFSSVADIDFLSDEDLVIGIVNGELSKAYPHPILDWHEIVNDGLSNQQYALTYCPLTGTAVAWDRDVNGQITTFGVSGKLYNTNLMPYDRSSDSYWSQLRLDCVHGDLVGTKIAIFPIIETTWATWKKAYPNSEVLNLNTGHSRNYERYPYGDYRTNHNNIIFPVNPMDNRLESKERVLGVLSDETQKVYSIEFFSTGRVIEDVIDGKDIIIIGSKEDNYMVGFENPGLSNLEYLADDLPYIAKDQDGNKITLSGLLEGGTLAGTQLTNLDAIIGYYFSLAAFYKNIEIFEE